MVQLILITNQKIPTDFKLNLSDMESERWTKEWPMTQDLKLCKEESKGKPK